MFYSLRFNKDVGFLKAGAYGYRSWYVSHLLCMKKPLSRTYGKEAKTYKLDKKAACDR
jgi:hypothetical protein